jgi:hypothetical protein
VRIVQLTHRLSTVESQAEADRVAAKAEVAALSRRVASLENASFHPEQIAEAVLPSVFRVKAGARRDGRLFPRPRRLPHQQDDGERQEGGRALP